MNRLMELIDVLSDKSVQARRNLAKRSHVCKICQKPAVKFESATAELQYEISGICEDCQDYYFTLPDA